MIKLRAHHLLCTQAYEGYGYSESFVINMNEKVARLRGKQDVEIELCHSLDDLCRHCPHAEKKTCENEHKVQLMDQKVFNHFKLTPGVYDYQQVIQDIQNNITSEILEDICGHCSWYEGGNCANLILKKSH